MKFLNGLKTILGLGGTVIGVLFPKIAPEVVQTVGEGLWSIATGAFGMLGALGLIHKAEKAAPKK